MHTALLPVLFSDAGILVLQPLLMSDAKVASNPGLPRIFFPQPRVRKKNCVGSRLMLKYVHTSVSPCLVAR